jgi:hypothetical protein
MKALSQRLLEGTLDRIALQAGGQAEEQTRYADQLREVDHSVYERGPGPSPEPRRTRWVRKVGGRLR